ncbi:hypothetical protein E2C01_034338 [Portunus trituberculatus]|uniref:Uncharacterized protein n=1 Tax=Portunus trituberculatus TaxID=210409 RepID=A0A5B7F0E9_PORTR|nr:hypothetical protein [Portunus trituberculatus]
MHAPEHYPCKPTPPSVPPPSQSVPSSTQDSKIRFSNCFPFSLPVHPEFPSSRPHSSRFSPSLPPSPLLETSSDYSGQQIVSQ